MAIFNFFKKKKNIDEKENIDLNVEVDLSIKQEIITKDNVIELNETIGTELSNKEIITKDDIIENDYLNNQENDFSSDEFNNNTIIKEEINIVEETLNIDININISDDEINELETVNNVIENIEAEVDSENLISTDEYVNEKDLEKEKKIKNVFSKISSGLGKTREHILSSIDEVLKNFTKIDDELFEELEEALIMADVGVETSVFIINKLKENVKLNKIKESADVKKCLIDEIINILKEDEDELNLTSPTIILVIGVNGVGKTTTIGKLANNYRLEGKKVLLAAGDTFRAAATEQLEIWAQRSNVSLIKHKEGADPGAVIFDAIQSFKSKKMDILICDTAGRLHNKKNLMEELKKIYKIISNNFSEANLEVFLVLDSTSGQNAVQQAKSFKEIADITGLVLTKIDGTAKGGVIIAIKNELKLPVRYVGVGEGINDLEKFEAEIFAKALFNE